MQWRRRLVARAFLLGEEQDDSLVSGLGRLSAVSARLTDWSRAARNLS